VVNVDCIGNSRGKGFNFHGWDEAKPLVAKMAGEMSESIQFASQPNAYSDHFNFLVHGIPNCGLGSIGGGGGGRGYGHTIADSYDKVSRADMREAACMLARTLVRFANDRHWALKHKTRDEVKEMLERFEILTVQRVEGTLPEVLK
jgi:Zn-dependent M28 family amino/carboxypeptidase